MYFVFSIEIGVHLTKPFQVFPAVRLCTSRHHYDWGTTCFSKHMLTTKAGKWKGLLFFSCFHTTHTFYCTLPEEVKQTKMIKLEYNSLLCSFTNAAFGCFFFTLCGKALQKKLRELNISNLLSTQTRTHTHTGCDRFTVISDI